MAEPIEQRKQDGEERFFLEGRELRDGDLVELQSENGEWHSARFDAKGIGDLGGHLLLVFDASLSAPPKIPSNAPCRWPKLLCLRGEQGDELALSHLDWRQFLALVRIGGFDGPLDADVFSRTEARRLRKAVKHVLADLAPKPQRPYVHARSTALEWFGDRRKVLAKLTEFLAQGAFSVTRD